MVLTAPLVSAGGTVHVLLPQYSARGAVVVLEVASDCVLLGGFQFPELPKLRHHLSVARSAEERRSTACLVQALLLPDRLYGILEEQSRDAPGLVIRDCVEDAVREFVVDGRTFQAVRTRLAGQEGGRVRMATVFDQEGRLVTAALGREDSSR